MPEFLKKFISFFITINSGILLVIGLFTIGDETIPADYIWKIFIISALTALVTAGVFSINPKRPMKRYVNVLIFIGHFISLCAIVFIGGTKFGWFDFSVKGLLWVAGSVGVVYIFTALIYIFSAKKEAKDLNAALKDFKE